MHLTYRNVNEAFTGLVRRVAYSDMIRKGNGWMDQPGNPFPLVETQTRAGTVLQVTEPIIVTYTHPWERVLFNKARDANPFFHLFESLWMLAGRNDVKPLEYYNSKIADIASDDGETFNGAYGYRWRNTGLVTRPLGDEVDQLEIIIDQLKRKPESRRVVLQMWNVEDDLLKIDVTKDVCCNTHAYFLVNNGRLDMTVCNRSNDMIWGMLGANVVHFAFLQEYIALALGIPMGVYNQMTNNLHVYLNNWKPEAWLNSTHCESYPSVVFAPYHLYEDRKDFDRDCEAFIDNPDAAMRSWFMRHVASPMCLAFRHHQERDYVKAYEALRYVAAPDWKAAGYMWIRKREQKWVLKNPEANPYLARELGRQAEEFRVDEA